MERQEQTQAQEPPDVAPVASDVPLAPDATPSSPDDEGPTETVVTDTQEPAAQEPAAQEPAAQEPADTSAKTEPEETETKTSAPDIPIQDATGPLTEEGVRRLIQEILQEHHQMANETTNEAVQEPVEESINDASSPETETPVQEATPAPEETSSEEDPFQSFLSTMDESQRTQIETHIAGMSTALKQERDERKRLERELKKVSSAAEEGTQYKQQLEQVAATAAEEAARAAFYEQAMQAGVHRSSLRLAYLAARDAKILGPDGSADWDALQDNHPNLFDQGAAVMPKATTSAGSGTGQAPKQPRTMNNVIRAASGRES